MGHMPPNPSLYELWHKDPTLDMPYKQAITCYFEHNAEMEVYSNLMSDPMMFKLWLDEEHVYLKSLLHKPPEETLQMEYWQWLVNLATSRQDLETILSTWTIITTQSVAPIQSNSSATRKRETMCCHTQENFQKDLKAVQELEGCLGITHHWVLEDEEWQAAACLVANRKALQGIHFISILEGPYKHTQQPYGLPYCNTTLQPKPSATEHWNSRRWLSMHFWLVLTFSGTWWDISTDLWASPTTWLAINMYFKLCQAKEEVVHLNMKITTSELVKLPTRILILCLHIRFPGISTSCGLGDIASVFQQMHMKAILSSSLVCADDREEDINEEANEDHGAILEDQYEAFENILSVTMDA
ncbi:hypothetical protein EDD16DRAFT_1524548 [Pisolithus croceorrhizus]|nr:hypothetical protein EDD16DRAFT_1524548 [Pisolithus croceorrhizus]KAI6113303.1 hypothetical protein EV401DRAFT_1890332 [Pisolithus croceorrhizus]KAI6167748.1 hypothetical protein EDD17DRAFT_1503971 [Pisolithus thermaeus]